MIDSWIQELVGVPYNAKGESPEQGFSCAALCLWCYRHIGLKLPGDSILMWRKHGEFLSDKAALEKYDTLVWKAGRLDVALHVGFYIGGGEVLHSARNVGQVSLLRLNHASRSYSAVWRPLR